MQIKWVLTPSEMAQAAAGPLWIYDSTQAQGHYECVNEGHSCTIGVEDVAYVTKEKHAALRTYADQLSSEEFVVNLSVRSSLFHHAPSLPVQSEKALTVRSSFSA